MKGLAITVRKKEMSKTTPATRNWFSAVQAAMKRVIKQAITGTRVTMA